MKQKFYLLLLLIFLSGSVFSQTIPSYVPTNGLVGWWPFNGNANDESGNGNHGTVNGATLTTDKNGNQNKAYNFDGNDCINIPNVVSSSSFTISIWLNSNDNSIGQQNIFYQGTKEWGIAKFNLSNGLKYLSGGVKLSDGNHYSTPGIYVNDNVWYHLCMTYSQGGKVKFYINSILVDSSVSSPNIGFFTGWATNASIGSYNGSSLFYKGKLDDISVYNRVLNQNEINIIYANTPNCSPNNLNLTKSINSSELPYNWNGVIFYNNGVQTKYLNSVLGCDSIITLNLTVTNSLPNYIPNNGLVAWWPFNGNVNDESGNGNNGTINGALPSNDRFGNQSKAYSFGVNKNITKSNFTFGGGNYSISFWLNLIDTINTQRILTHDWDNFGTFSTAYLGQTKEIESIFNRNENSNYVKTNNVLKKNNWYHLTVTVENNIHKIYVNSNLLNVATCTVPNTNTKTLFIGGDNSHPLYGSLDDIAIFNRALSQAEISALYNGSFNIVASSSANGSISPSGTTTVNSGSSQTYTFSPNSGYWIDSVIVNGVQVPTASSYTFSNVTSDQNIRVTYRSLAAALAAANICANDTLVSTVNLPAFSNVRATTYYSNIYLFNQNNTGNAYKYNVNDRKYTAITNKPSPCIECGVAEANGKVYCFNTNGTTQAYDIATNTWQNQANQTSTSTSSVYAASINNKIYILGTNNNQNTFTQYNPQTNSYSALANPTINANQSRLVAFNYKLYKIGGTDNNSQAISSVEVYNPSNNTWTAMPDLPEALTQVGATHYDNKLYVFGGKQINNTNSNKVYVFDFTSNAWYQQSNTQNTNRTNIEAKTANNMVFLFGGTDTTNTQTNQAQRYFCKDQLCTCKWAEYVCAGVSSDVPCNTLSPSIHTLQQDTSANAGNLYNGTVANNVTVTLNYTGANGASYKERAISSIGVTGLTATLAAGTLNNGNGTLVLSISGTPNTTGTANFSITIGSKTCVFTREVKAMLYKAGTVFCNGTPTEVVEVTNPITGRTWMDRNLGASRAATSSDDSLAYGDLYQWGRGADGHQCRNSATTTILSTTDQPGHGMFISETFNNAYDWRINSNNNLWQGVNGMNNPCPSGFRLPTINELFSEKETWTNGAFNSILKFSLPGTRDFGDGSYSPDMGFVGNYWSITIENSKPFFLLFYEELGNLSFYKDTTIKTYGHSIRCIKDYTASISSIDTIGSSNQGILYSGQASNNVSTTINYKNGNGALYDSQFVQSTGVTGLTAILAAGNLNNGDGSLFYTISGTPNTTGTAIFNIAIAGKTCVFTREVKVLPYKAGTVFCNGVITDVVELTDPLTGMVWMDRNLGASRAANSVDDSLAYGDLYQWGRGADGHQCRNSATTTTLSTTDQPGHNKFIVQLSQTWPFDWQSIPNFNLWQGTEGINNPCPTGFRVPSYFDFNKTLRAWFQAGLFNNSNVNHIGYQYLKLVNSGVRFMDGTQAYLGDGGEYWTSTTRVWSGIPNVFQTPYSSLSFNVYNGGATEADYMFNYGLSVRCIKDIVNNTIGMINSLEFDTSSVLIQKLYINTENYTRFRLKYSGGNGGIFPSQIVKSTGITGLTAIITSDTLSVGNGFVSFEINGIANDTGIANFMISIDGKSCIFNLEVKLPAFKISSIYQDTNYKNEKLYNGIQINNTSLKVNYSGSNGGKIDSLNINSYGVNGITAKITSSISNVNSGVIYLTLTGLPDGSGTAYFNFSLGGMVCSLSVAVNSISVGSIYGGGLVISTSISQGQTHGIILALQDQGSYSWGCTSKNIIGTSFAFGTGKSNTDYIKNGNCGDAAAACYNLNKNGYTDWYLPSLNELGFIYNNKASLNNSLISNGGTILSNYYWSSTQLNDTNAFFLNFNNGGGTSFTKTYSAPVRAMRSF